VSIARGSPLRSAILPLLALSLVGCGADSGDRRTGARESGPVGLAIAGTAQIFAGRAAMLFDGAACTSEEGAPGDRWCGFVALVEGERHLFVVNVTQVSAGVPVSCGDEDPNCLLLTPSLGGDGRDPTWHGTSFRGDTLVYYDASLAPHAWRPGMPSGRLLAAASADMSFIFCLPAQRGTAVACLGLPHTQADETLAWAELLAGKADGESEPLLSPVDSVLAANAADLGGFARFSYDFPKLEGDYLVWSTREAPDGPEVVKLVRVGEPESKLTVASDAHDWQVSVDGSRWFWVSALEPNGAGMLRTARFPDGADATDVLGNVTDYGVDPAGTPAVVTLSAQAEVVTVPEPARAPERRVTIDTSVQALLELSDEGHLAYAKHFVGTNIVDLFVSKLDGTGDCAVDTTTSVPKNSILFSPSSKSAAWAVSKGYGYDGHYTRLADCTSSALAPDILTLDWIGQHAVLFMNGFDDDAGTGSMRFRNVARDHALEPVEPTTLAEHVDTYALSRPAPGAVAYTVNGTEWDGVYITWFAP
jgi:hypothetical protein